MKSYEINGNLELILNEIGKDKLRDIINEYPGKKLIDNYFEEYFKPNYVILEEDNVSYTGVAIVENIPGTDAHYLDKLIVHSKKRSNGTGKRLLDSAIKYSNNELILRACPDKDEVNAFYGGMSFVKRQGIWVHDKEINKKRLGKLVSDPTGDWIIYSTPALRGKDYYDTAKNYVLNKEKTLIRL